MICPKIFSFFFICLLAACGNSVLQNESANRKRQTDKTKLSLIMKRTGCYGTCPIYDLNIQPDGKVLFEGKGFTKIIGKAEDKISDEKINELAEEIKKANFFLLDDAYNSKSGNCPTFATDSSNVTLYIKINGKEKTINHYLGCQDDYRKEIAKGNSNEIPVIDEAEFTKRIFPQQLYNLENKIDEIVETERWIGERK
jgi:hypothetical protein